MEEQFDFYPPKPVLPKKEEKSGWSMTVLSLVLFVASFMILFADRVQFLVFLIIVLFILTVFSEVASLSNKFIAGEPIK